MNYTGQYTNELPEKFATWVQVVEAFHINLRDFAGRQQFQWTGEFVFGDKDQVIDYFLLSLDSDFLKARLLEEVMSKAIFTESQLRHVQMDTERIGIRDRKRYESVFNVAKYISKIKRFTR